MNFNYLTWPFRLITQEVRNNKNSNLLERLFGSVVDAGLCIIRIMVSKIIWKIDFVEIMRGGGFGHRIWPRRS